MIGLNMMLGIAAGILPAHVAPAPAQPPNVPVAVVAPTPVVVPTPTTGAVPTTTTTTVPLLGCALTWTLNVPFGFGQPDGEMASAGTSGTYSVSCSGVAALEATFPAGTTFSVAPDPGPNP
jgi:hypothetical protein